MPKTKAKKEYRCAVCNRRLKDTRWVYSTTTGNRYCLPSEGCQR